MRITLDAKICLHNSYNTIILTCNIVYVEYILLKDRTVVLKETVSAQIFEIYYIKEHYLFILIATGNILLNNFLIYMDITQFTSYCTQ